MPLCNSAKHNTNNKTNESFILRQPSILSCLECFDGDFAWFDYSDLGTPTCIEQIQLKQNHFAVCENDLYLTKHPCSLHSSMPEKQLQTNHLLPSRASTKPRTFRTFSHIFKNERRKTIFFFLYSDSVAVPPTTKSSANTPAPIRSYAAMKGLLSGPSKPQTIGST
jgi:hypothetical protein